MWDILSRRGLSASVSTSWQHRRYLDVATSDEAMLFIVDVSCTSSETLLVQAGNKNLFSFPHRWFITVAGDHGHANNDTLNAGRSLEDDLGTDGYKTQRNPGSSSLHSLLNLLPLHVDSQVVIGKSTPGVGFVLTEVFKRGSRQAPLVSQMIGEWNMESGLKLSQLISQPVSIRRLDLMGTKVTAAIVVTDNDTLTKLSSLGNKHIDTITKLNYALFVHLVEVMNASMEVIHTASWGYATNGSWNGMAGYLQRGEADVGATALFFTKDRMDVMEYIAMTSPTKIRFVFRQPPLSYVSNVFALPFSGSVWISSAILVALTGVLLYGALRWEAKRDITPLDLEIEQHLGAKIIGRTTWSDVALLSLGAVCQQGSTVEPRSVAGRLVTLILFIAVIFLYTSYSASIVALLQSSTDSINTLHDLLHSRLDVGVHDIVYNHHYFKDLLVK